MTSNVLVRVAEGVPLAGLDFEYCAVQQTETKTFVLHNSSNSLVQFEAVTEMPLSDGSGACQAFSVEPKMGKLPFSNSNTFTVT